MPEISVRGLEMPESPIRKLAPLAAAAKTWSKGISPSTSVSLTFQLLNVA